MERKQTDLAIEYIKSRILNFTILPGVKISDDEVAKNLGTSRTPVREALNRLAEQGLVVYRPNRGFTVKVFNRKAVQDNYVLREALECLAVRLCIANINEEKKATLNKLLSGYPKIIKSNDLSLFSRADEEFHDLIAVYSENMALYKTLENLHGVIRVVRRYDHLRAGSFEETYNEHRSILEQINLENATKATKQMSNHIINSMKTVMRFVPE